MRYIITEFIGTFALIFFGCGTIIFMGEQLGLLGISLAFGLTVLCIAYAFGPISGAHLNPAVSIGALISGRILLREFFQYVIAQISGALFAVFILYLMGGDVAMAVTVPGTFGIGSALTYEIIATFLFVTIILSVTQDKNNLLAGVAIGIALVVVHLTGINVSGASVNPVRTLATNIFNPDALGIIWLYFLGPLLGGVIAGLAHRMGLGVQS